MLCTSKIDAVGRTPLVPITSWSPSAPRAYAKLERFNPSGNAKDRTAAAILSAALTSGQLTTGGTLVESNSGNLGVALAQQARWHGVRFICVIDPRTHATARRAIRSMARKSCVSKRLTRTPATGWQHVSWAGFR